MRSCSNQFFFLATVISMLFFIVVLIISAGRVCVIQGEREGRGGERVEKENRLVMSL